MKVAQRCLSPPLVWLPKNRDFDRRRGISWFAVVTGLVFISAAAGATVWLKPWEAFSDAANVPLTTVAFVDNFQHMVTERGEVESSSNAEVRCEVAARNFGSGSSTTILEIVPEGTYVKKGDLICRLDASALENERNQQQIIVIQSESAVAQATANLQSAEIARQEYLEGTFKVEESTFEAEIAVEEENLRRAQDYAEHSKELFAKGYVTKLQLEADLFAVINAQTELENGKTKLHSLREYTKPKMLSQLDADIEVQKANLEQQNKTLSLDREKLKTIEEEILKCEVRAPVDGQVVYANERSRRGGSEVVIEQGAPVKEQQPIVRLPDPTQMQVRAKINEARINRVRPGLGAIIHVDAYPNLELRGSVTKVEDYADSSSWWSNVKEYAAVVRIQNPPEGLRPGLTAEVQIQVEFLPEVLQVPVQAVVEHGGKHYCFLQNGEQLESRPVTIGSTNDKHVVIKDGLKADEIVMLNPRKYQDKWDLPDLGELNTDKAVAQIEADDEYASSSSDSAANEKRPPQDGGTEGGGKGPGGDPAARLAAFMKRIDTDGDGKLSAGEMSAMPEQMRAGMAKADTNGDGFVDSGELAAAMAAFRRKMQGPPASPASAGGGGGGE